jgi:Fe-S-cluster containining protein
MSGKKLSLELINPHESGLLSFDRLRFEKTLKIELEKVRRIDRYPDNREFRELLNLLAQRKFQEIENTLKARPDLESLLEIKAIKFLSFMFLGKDLKQIKIFQLSNPNSISFQKISFKLSALLLDLYELLKNNLIEFSQEFGRGELDFWSLEEVLPALRYLYSQYVLEKKLSEKYPMLLEKLEEDTTKTEEIFEKAYDWGLERLRLLAFYHRRQNIPKEAEEFLLEFREALRPNQETNIRIKSLGNREFFPANEVFSNWQNILDECDEIQKDIVEIVGLEANTCEYFKCADCCKNPFPVMSLTEFKYMKNWLTENNYPVEEIHEKSRSIQSDYKEKHGEELKIIDKSILENKIRGIENPTAYKYECPFLKENRCSVYQARPLLCRGFGLATDNNISLKTCKYYLSQYQNSLVIQNERIAYDLRPAQTLARISDNYLSNNKQLSGTIVAWFTCDEEQI